MENNGWNLISQTDIKTLEGKKVQLGRFTGLCQDQCVATFRDSLWLTDRGYLSKGWPTHWHELFEPPTHGWHV